MRAVNGSLPFPTVRVSARNVVGCRVGNPARPLCSIEARSVIDSVQLAGPSFGFFDFAGVRHHPSPEGKSRRAQ